MPMVTDPTLCLPAWADGLAVFCLGAGTQTGFPGSVACTPQTMTACTGANPSQRCHWTSTLQLLVDIWLCICGGLTELVIIKEKELLLTVPSEWWTLEWIFRKLFLCLGRKTSGVRSSLCAWQRQKTQTKNKSNSHCLLRRACSRGH